MPRPHLLLGLLVVTTLAAACSDDLSSPATTGSDTTAAPSTTAAATTTTASAADAAMAYADAGPFPVGVSYMLETPGGNRIEVWYPAVPGTTGTDSYDMRDYVPDEVRALLTADVPAGATYAAGRDADIADGTFPVVLFSHGFAGMRMQSTFLTAHLASWGMIVVAPEHPSRDLEAVLRSRFAIDEDPAVEDLTQSLDLIIVDGDDSTSPFHGHVDGERVAAIGHSAGGLSVVQAVSNDTRIDGYVSLASYTIGLRAVDRSTAVPSLFIAGSVDGVVSAEKYTRPSYEAAESPSALWVIEGAGHNAFDDFCTFGNGSGIIGIADASGVAPLLDTVPFLRTLGENGCKPPAVAVETTFPIIRHAVTAWLRQLFGIDATPVGLGTDVADQYATPVEITTK
ncbi:MAG: alpha/beta hydrolase [Actinomycetota bacterium]|nr:alpha/beta hydrolase [Actinomycetota bacterium]